MSYIGTPEPCQAPIRFRPDGVFVYRNATMLEVALGYAAQGIPVFPLAPGDKVPLIPKRLGGRGVLDATADAAIIRRWWTKHPTANIGLAAGVAFWVVDVDSNGLSVEPDGLDYLRELTAEFGPLPDTPRAHTGSGGRHYLFRPDERIKNCAKALPGLDTRSRGGYVVAPPSVHPGTGNRYRWIVAPGEAPLAIAPDWLVALLEPPTVAPRSPGRPVRRVPDGRGANGRIADPIRYTAAALKGACGRIAAAPWGAQADMLDHESWNIGRLVGAGLLDRSTAVAALNAAGRSMASQPGKAPWTAVTIARRVDRALAKGEVRPIDREVRA